MKSTERRHDQQSESGTCAFDPLLFMRQIDYLYQQLPPAIITSSLAALLICIIGWSIEPNKIIVYWFAAFSMITVFRIYLMHIFPNSSLAVEYAGYWLMLYMFGCFISGLLWGGLGYLFVTQTGVNYYDSVLIHCLIVLFIIALASDAIITYSSNLLAFLSFFMPAILPYAVYLMLQNDHNLNSIGLMFLSYSLIIFTLSMKKNRRVKEILSTRLQPST